MDGPGTREWLAGVDRESMHFIAEGVTELAGFGVAAISIARDGWLHTVAVAGREDAAQDLLGRRTPVDAVLAELATADRWGALRFLPEERASGHLQDHAWVPDLPGPAPPRPDDWRPGDLLCGLLTDASGELRGLLAMDLPTNGRRPTAAQRRVLQLYTRQAGRAVLTALERDGLALDLVEQRSISSYRDRLVAVLAHEVMTPVTVIQANVELLAGGVPATRDSQRSLAAIGRGAARVGSLFDDFRQLSRVDPVEREPAADDVDLRDVVEDVVADFEPVAASGLVRLDLEVEPLAPGDGWVVRGDRPHLEALVANLVSNAVKYTDPMGGVRVCLSRSGAGSPGDPGARDDPRVQVSVVDTGIGIASGDLPCIFGEFFRSPDPAAQRRPGTGLGLSIAHHVVRRHGGQIRVDSVVGRGTTVVVDLPGSGALRG